MKRVIIICEGSTEQEFCKSMLSPFFLQNNIIIEHPRIFKSNGGMVHWDSIKKQIETHLKQDTTAIVTTLFDYYGLNIKKGFPEFEESNKVSNKSERMDFLELKMKQNINKELSFRFYP